MSIEKQLKTWQPNGSIKPLFNLCHSWEFIENCSYTLNIHLGFHCPLWINELKEHFFKTYQSTLEVHCKSHIRAHQTQKKIKPLKNIKNIIAVSSTKGGVGKSTIAAFLAQSLAKDASVGLLDADIYGANIPHIFKAHDRPEVNEHKQCIPIEKNNVHLMSIGYLTENQDTPMIWRGPMVVQAYQHLLTQTAWPSLDYLIIDMPPGTGDIQLTMAQKTPISGSLIVTTGHQLSVEDCIKGINMFQKMDIPVLGLVENMSSFICPNCSTSHSLFKDNHTHRIDSDILRIANLPWCEDFSKTDGQWLGYRVAAELSLRPKDSLHKMPNVIIQK